jgi:dethiobiotin synthetase
VARFVAIAGTDTGVGKTFVGRGLARALVASGRRTLAVKPVESGCEGDREGEDGVLLAAATGQPHPREALVRLRAPLAPAVAAEREGVTVDVEALADAVVALAADADVVLVEGAGGLSSPWSWTGDLVRLAQRVAARVLVVGADRLGTLGHVRAAVQVLFAARLRPLGIVLSAPAEADASMGTNAAALARLFADDRELSRRILGLARTDADGAALALRPVLEWIG